MVKSLILMRHAEREDRAQEKRGIDWISTAPRPQDPVLSEKGRRQASAVGDQLKDVGITKILTSPMIRTVISADLVAEQIGLGPKSICVEMGLVEEAKSFRGKTSAEPRPNWSPLILPPAELSAYSSRLDLDYKTLVEVKHERDDSKPNTVAEVHPTLTDRDEITLDRCKNAVYTIIACEDFKDDVILCVGHGATVKAYTKALQAELPEEEQISGERGVSCFAEFRPVDPANPMGPWKAVSDSWRSGDVQQEGSAEAAEDGGFVREESEFSLPSLEKDISTDAV